MVKKLKINKKGMDLSLNTVVLLIICVLVMILLIFFFIKYYGGNGKDLTNAGNSAIDYAKNFSG